MTMGTYSNLGREVEFSINGTTYKVSDNVPADTLLNTFIRDHAHLKGTKFMCLEGGCGACVVSIETLHPSTNQSTFFSVNSCLVPIFACHGWSITTVEGLGNNASGYHKIQKRLAAANGTQCGYCTPGMVMNMNSLFQNNPKITMKEVENSFGGNICRCTGYRPILDAAKSLAVDASSESIQKLQDIEDMICPKSGGKCSTNNCSSECKNLGKTALKFELMNGSGWYRPVTIKEVFKILDVINNKQFKFIGGNTAKGLYVTNNSPEIYIDLNGIAELHNYEIKRDSLTLGANISLTEAMAIFQKSADQQPKQFSYCKTLVDHIDLVANVPVRNIGSLAGNLSIKHKNNEFPSDVFLILEMVGANVIIADGSGIDTTMGLTEYLKMDMNKKLIVKISLPALDENSYITRSYKIMPRAQNSLAYVNAGFLVKVNKNKEYTVIEKPSILFGGINPDFIHAEKTENYLVGKKLLDNKTLDGALTILESELKPNHVLPDTLPAFRKGLAVSLFYKFILSVDPNKVSDRNRSGGLLLQRPVSNGKQDFETDQNVWPLNKPIPKIEALLQCAGEAEYTNDIPSLPEEVWGELVLAEKSLAIIDNIDTKEALKMPGVITFLSVKDIPGKNSFMQPSMFAMDEEVLFTDGKVDYAGQAVGVIIATTQSIAFRAANKVNITYKSQGKVMVDMKKIIEEDIKDRITERAHIAPKIEKSNTKYKVKGQLNLKSQYHYPMETFSCLALPKEDHLDIYPTSQWPTSVQEVVSLVLGIPQNKININVRRIGGGYGSKITRSNHIAAVCSLAAYLLRRPVRMVLTMTKNMKWSGKRFPVFSDYEVGVDEEGEIQYLNASVYQDDGYSSNESAVAHTIDLIKNVYDSSVYNIKAIGVRTDKPSNTWCRAPGSTEAITLIENIMEHIANVVKKDPISVRLVNMNKENNPIPQMLEDVKKISDYDNRVTTINQFNKENRWKKRGISMVPMNYPFFYWGCFNSTVSIFGLDGSISISHGAIEMGQGVNTKAAQVAAHILGVEVELVTVRPTSNIMSPNNSPTGGSLGSEAVSYAVKMCCEELNKRLEPIKKELGEKASWKDIIATAYKKNVNLNYTYLFTPRDDVKPYAIYGVVVIEVEVDILTGQYHSRRVDMIEDAGQSLSPEVDIGQVEGAFIMGLGYFTCEETIYNQESGLILTNSTWTYHPPGAKDIPIDFRITFRKNAKNPVGVLHSKATGEPPLCLSCSVLFAIRNALESARTDGGYEDESWFDIEPPYTGEKIWLSGGLKKEMFKL